MWKWRQGRQYTQASCWSSVENAIASKCRWGHLLDRPRRSKVGLGRQLVSKVALSATTTNHRLKMAPLWTWWPHCPASDYWSDRWSSGLSSRFTPCLICNWHCQLAGPLADNWWTSKFLGSINVGCRVRLHFCCNQTDLSATERYQAPVLGPMRNKCH